MNNQIECPKCGHNFDVEEVLSTKIQLNLESKFKQMEEAKEKELEQERLKLEKMKEDLLKLETNQLELVKSKVEEELQKKKEGLEIEISKRLEEAQTTQTEAMRKELNEKSEQLKQMHSTTAELEKLKRDMREVEDKAKADAQKQITIELEKAAEKMESKAAEKYEFKIKEIEKQLNDQKQLTEEMKRKQEQGSMQLQGEVQELALEELLKVQYPFDRIEEVPKGVSGADCVQTVINKLQTECGSIVYESKRTKSFSSQWIDKLKQDQLTCKADIAVLVTETMPSGQKQFFELDGIWVCSFQEVKSLSFVLRSMLIKLNSLTVSNTNKGEKKELLYSYFSSPEFIQTIKRIIDTYDVMTDQLNKEKKAYTKMWKAREKQIESVQLNMASLFGSIEGIVGNVLDSSGLLELPEGDEE